MTAAGRESGLPEEGRMTYIIAEPCVGTKDAACVEVCPVDCIHPTRNDEDFETAEMLYIDPDECIDCGACEPVCPVNAIYPEDELPAEWEAYIAKNADYFKDK
jgi:ferredoxin